MMPVTVCGILPPCSVWQPAVLTALGDDQDCMSSLTSCGDHDLCRDCLSLASVRELLDNRRSCLLDLLLERIKVQRLI